MCWKTVNARSKWIGEKKVRMNQEKLIYFKGLLEGKIHTLLEEAGKAVNGMGQERSEDFPDPTDRASLESDRNFQLRIKDRERKLIQKIKEALDRIEDGSFGTCESCGKPISEKRLMARPMTTQCIDCKTEDEQKERLERLRGTRETPKFPS
jgi:DnaK suppressor protein